MESPEEREGRSGSAGSVAGTVTAGAVIVSSLAVTLGPELEPELFWLDIAVHLVAFAVAFVASIRNGRALGFLLVVLSPVVMFWGLGQLDLQGCMYYGGEHCQEGTSSVVGAYVVGTALLAGGAALAFLPKRKPVDPGSVGNGQTAMERYQTDLLELRRQGTISEAHHQTRLEEVRRLARQKAEGAITDDEYEAAAAKLLDSKTDRPSAPK